MIKLCVCLTHIKTLQILELLREAEGLKMYADVYTKLYDTYYKIKDEKATLQDDMDIVQVNILYTRLQNFMEIHIHSLNFVPFFILIIYVS